MASQKLYALLVGINEYFPGEERVKDLNGSVNDIEHVAAKLRQYYAHLDPQIVLLKNEEAKRDNIIRHFRQHLRDQADENSTALFMYSGHGSQQYSKKALRAQNPHEKYEETIICHDSRQKSEQGKYVSKDISDKELGTLVKEVADQGAHTVVWLDCCHSGSGTRDADDLVLGATRQIGMRQADHSEKESTAQEDILRIEVGEELPTSKHVLLAACQYDQLAREIPKPIHQGLFTKSLLAAMDHFFEKHQKFSYADLFEAARIKVLQYTHQQSPKYDSYGYFNAHSTFLEGIPMKDAQVRRNVFYQQSAWKIKLGAADGLSSNTEHPITVTIYDPSNDTLPLVQAAISSVGLEESTLEPDRPEALNQEVVYQAQLTTTLIPAITFRLVSEHTISQQDLDILRSSTFALSTEPEVQTKYQIRLDREPAQVLRGQTLVYPQEEQATVSLEELAWAMHKIARWERLLALANPRAPQYLRDQVEVWLDLNDREELKQKHILVYCYPEKDGTAMLGKVPFLFKIKNQSEEGLYFNLLYFNNEYGVSPMYNQKIASSDTPKILLKDTFTSQDRFESQDILKLLVSKRESHDYTFQQGDFLEDTFPKEGARSAESQATVKEAEIEMAWFSQMFIIHSIQHLGSIQSTESLSIAEGQIEISAHPRFQAEVALRSAESWEKGLEVIPELALRFDYELLNFSAQPQREQACVLELRNYEGAESLKAQPLAIKLNTPLEAGEHLLPLTFDGHSVYTMGNILTESDGKYVFNLNQIPETKGEWSEVAKPERTFRVYFLKVKEAPHQIVEREEWIQVLDK